MPQDISEVLGHETEFHKLRHGLDQRSLAHAFVTGSCLQSSTKLHGRRTRNTSRAHSQGIAVVLGYVGWQMVDVDILTAVGYDGKDLLISRVRVCLE